MTYPTAVWDGDTPNRDRSLAQAKSPNSEDWNVLTAELIATQTELTRVSAGGGVDKIFVDTAPVSHILPALSVGVYGTPVVDATLVDNIAFTANMSTATNKTAADTSCMAAFIGVSNTADTTNNKLQGLLASANVGFDCYDAYAVQGHITVGVGGVATQNANAHITGISGKALLTGNCTQGWVTGVLAIVDGTGTTGGLCHVIAAVAEATTTASQVDALLYLNADQTVVSAITLAGTANMTAFLTANAVAGCVVANALVPEAAPDAGTVGAAACLVCDIGGTPYYIPLYDTLHA